MRRHHYHSFWRRGLASLALVCVVMTVGTVGFHLIEKYSILDAFYFMSMIATAQGPATIPTTPAGKLFAALMAFISVGSLVTAFGFLLGPFFGKLWKIGVEKLEEEMHRTEGKDRSKES